MVVEICKDVPELVWYFHPFLALSVYILYTQNSLFQYNWHEECKKIAEIIFYFVLCLFFTYDINEILTFFFNNCFIVHYSIYLLRSWSGSNLAGRFGNQRKLSRLLAGSCLFD